MEEPKPSDPQQDLKEEFSLEQRLTPSALPISSSPPAAITFFRFVIWISPGPACLIAITLIYQLFPLPPIFVILFCILLSLLIGICDSFLSSSLPKNDGRPEWPATIGHSFVFAALQLVIAPLTIFVLGLGFCALLVATNA